MQVLNFWLAQNFSITYITASDAQIWRERYHHEEKENHHVERLSPKYVYYLV